MPLGLRSRGAWVGCLAGIVVVGLLSRAFHSGFLIFDKYLGDALYAAMVYVIFRIVWRSGTVALPAIIAMTALELFQLTRIPARLLGSEYLVVRVCARLMGTEFSWWDLGAYAVGIGLVWFVDPSREGT